VPPFATRWADARVALRRVERWFLPSECLLCQGTAPDRDDDPLVCDVCRMRWEALPEPVCERCGQPVDATGPCRLCAEWPSAVTRVRSAVWLTGGARATVHYLKYGGWWRLAEVMAPPLAGLALFRDSDGLVPVPLGASRRRVRGYNQCDVLARAVQPLVGVPVRGDVLTRRRETRRQTGLSADERRANVLGAFLPVGDVPRRPVVLDDVFTTGATLLAVADALLAGGAHTVRAVTFARARRPLDDDVAALDHLPSAPGLHR